VHEQRSRRGLALWLAVVLAACSPGLRETTPVVQEQVTSVVVPSTSTVPTTSSSLAPPTTLSELDELRKEQALERERETIRAEAAFSAYQQALLDADAAAAISLVSDATIEWYSESLLLAQSASPTELEAAPIHQFVSALQLRALLGSGVHEISTGSEAFGVLIEDFIPWRMSTEDGFRVYVDRYLGGTVYYEQEETVWHLWLIDGSWQVNVQYFNNYVGFSNDDVHALELLVGTPLTRPEYIDALETFVDTPVREAPPRS
jgi:hypothetical protein